ncbi:MAG: hypothetical protein LAT68_04855 [Cyclobacteriaceae bacterium]|nr:hypothetical protein [Cyclobacteriaceae bacterium]MCH8515641.1 hypothetical protein [Cyclobacteriaceae bacterium]
MKYCFTIVLSFCSVLVIGQNIDPRECVVRYQDEFDSSIGYVETTNFRLAENGFPDYIEARNFTTLSVKARRYSSGEESMVFEIRNRDLSRILKSKGHLAEIQLDKLPNRAYEIDTTELVIALFEGGATIHLQPLRKSIATRTTDISPQLFGDFIHISAIHELSFQTTYEEEFFNELEKNPLVGFRVQVYNRATESDYNWNIYSDARQRTSKSRRNRKLTQSREDQLNFLYCNQIIPRK